MKRRYLLSFLSSLLMTLMIAFGFNATTHLPANSQSTTLLVGAAASLKDALEELNPRFESANPIIRVRYNFAASGTIQQQITQGAPIDVFISAATRQMDALESKDLLVTGTRRNILTNSLALVASTKSLLKISDFQQLTNPNIKRIAVGEPRSVPAGQYAEEVFKNLGILDRLRPKFVFSNSVRNVLASVESGNADAGIVYVTDAKATKQIALIALASPRLHSPIVYPMAVVAATQNQQAARNYARFLTGREAKIVFKRYGFGLAE
ncbi:MAG: molybdate ABC transporter substrate-binding protein [Oscillatoriales cyanobacterium SM2_2_1]|nr:molybdate ABC transporter substrate-binding protein [Oscillatoriales cyanobacterium SM2_2_1]